MNKNALLKCIAGAIALAGLSACVQIPPAPAKGEVVPLKTLLAETKGRPFGCLFYEPSKDSCFGGVRYSINGNSGLEIGQLAVPNSSSSYLEVKQPFTIEGNRICADPNKVQIEPIGPAVANVQWIIDISRKAYVRKGELCSTFYRAEGGGYVEETVNRKGKSVEPDEHYRFFAEPKALRTKP